MSNLILSRRKFLIASAMGASSLVLAGRDQFDFLGQRDHQVRDFIERANSLTYQAQRLLGGQQAMSATYSESEIKQPQRPNGSTENNSDEYLTHKTNNNVDYKFRVTGMVEDELT